MVLRLVLPVVCNVAVAAPVGNGNDAAVTAIDAVVMLTFNEEPVSVT